jgi:hypothetical protein
MLQYVGSYIEGIQGAGPQILYCYIAEKVCTIQHTIRYPISFHVKYIRTLSLYLHRIRILLLTHVCLATARLASVVR